MTAIEPDRLRRRARPRRQRAAGAAARAARQRIAQMAAAARDPGAARLRLADLCASGRRPALHPAAPGAHLRRRSRRRLAAALPVAPRHAADHLPRRSPSRWSAASALAILFAQSRWIEMSLFPFAVILQVTPIVAISPLILIYIDTDAAGAADLRLDRRLLPDPVQHDARPALDRPQPPQPVRALRRDAAGRRWSSAACRRRCPISSAGLKIAGGLSLIGAVVAEFAAGTRAQASGLAFRASSRPATGSTSRACSRR